jgi:hypothetical protein
MPPVSPVERALLTAWQVELLRLTVFPSPLSQVKPERWWHDVVGEDAESSTSQPRRKALFQEGAVTGARLILSVEPTRIDWRLVPIESQQSGDPYTNIVVLPDVINSFISLISNWFNLETYPKTKRLAFGAVLLHPVNDRVLGYRQLSAYLPYVTLDAENSIDFLYRINRPRRSTSNMESLYINRLSTWAVRASGEAELSVGLASAQITMTPTSHACHLELDINTNQEFPGELSAKESLIVFRELVNLGLEIVREGDTK